MNETRKSRRSADREALRRLLELLPARDERRVEDEAAEWLADEAIRAAVENAD